MNPGLLAFSVLWKNTIPPPPCALHALGTGSQNGQSPLLTNQKSSKQVYSSLPNCFICNKRARPEAVGAPLAAREARLCLVSSRIWRPRADQLPLLIGWNSPGAPQRVFVSMGGDLSLQQRAHAGELYQLIKQSGGVRTSRKNIEELIHVIEDKCPWYPEGGSLNLPDWQKIGARLFQEPRSHIRHILLWQRCADALGRLRNVAPPTAPPVLASPSSPPPYAREPPTAPEAPPGVVPPPPSAPACSAVQAALQRAVREGGDGKNPLLEQWEGESPSFSLTYQGPRVKAAGEEAVRAHYTPLPYAVIRELNKGIRQSGLRSAYVQRLIEGIANVYTMLPVDWKQLFRMVLSPAQYVVWDSEFWAAALAIATPTNIPDQIYGSGHFSTAETQLELPVASFGRTALCIVRAFRRVPVTGKPLSSFTSIRQGPTEPFHQFVDRLKEAIARQIDNEEAQIELSRCLAAEQANVDCKKILQTVIHQDKYTLAEMIQACAEVGTQTHTVALLAGALPAGSKPLGNCFNCNKPGHFRCECRAPGGGASKDHGRPPGRPSKKCPCCNKGFHWANQCHSLPAGNPSAGPPRAKE
uniref:CCHC-type domain-containing protein n=1 Tax=Gopherus evgoodei TaxID=1825980 RepID=A0A8C4Y500_9SAUR